MQRGLGLIAKGSLCQCSIKSLQQAAAAHGVVFFAGFILSPGVHFLPRRYAVGTSSRVFIAACLCEVLESAAQLMELRQGLYSALIPPAWGKTTRQQKTDCGPLNAPLRGFI